MVHQSAEYIILIKLNLNKYIFSMIFWAVFFLKITAQNIYCPYVFPNQIPNTYNINADSTFKLNLLTTKNITSEIEKKYDFSEMVSYEKKIRFLSGKVYFDWYEMEGYLNEILQKILPDSLKTHKNIHVYVARDHESNAYATFDGSLYFNVGYLAELENEAELAIVLGHEITHYANKDVLNSYFSRLKNSKKSGRDFIIAQYERSQEQTADSIGFIYANQANYNLNAGYAFFNKMSFEEFLNNIFYINKGVYTIGSKKDSIRINEKLELNFSLNDHPRTQARKDLLHKFISNEKNVGKLNYLISKESDFLKMQQKIRYETLYLLMFENEYYQCLLKAFTYYIQRPDDETYYYYLIESLRKYILINENTEPNRGFLNSHSRTVLRYEDCILKNIYLLSINSSFKNKIKLKEVLYDKNLPFNNYTQAMDFFLNLGYKKKFSSALYTAALYYYNDDEKRTYYSNEYLNQSDIIFKDFISQLKSKKILTSLEQNTVDKLYIKKATIYQNRDVNSKYEYIEAEKFSKDYYKEILKNIKKEYPYKVIIDESEKSTINDVLFFNHINNSSKLISNLPLQNTTEKHSNIIYFDEDSLKYTKLNLLENLFLLEPDIWGYFNKNKLKQIEIVYPNYQRDKEYISGDFFSSKHQTLFLYNLDINVFGKSKIKSKMFS